MRTIHPMLARALAIALVAGACASASPPPRHPSTETTTPGHTTVPPQPAPAPSAASGLACCVPPGAEDPGDHSYQDCIAAGGRHWGTNGCGVAPDGSALAPPPQAE